jgi:hypothetical protein
MFMWQVLPQLPCPLHTCQDQTQWLNIHHSKPAYPLIGSIQSHGRVPLKPPLIQKVNPATKTLTRRRLPLNIKNQVTHLQTVHQRQAKGIAHLIQGQSQNSLRLKALCQSNHKKRIIQRLRKTIGKQRLWHGAAVV